jgi:hypothetical protein
MDVRIWWVQKRYPQYGIPIWCLWSNIRFLPSTITEKNATKNIWTDGQTDRDRYPISWEAVLDPSDSYFLFADLVGFYTHWTYMHIFIPPLPEGGGGILFYLCPSVLPSNIRSLSSIDTEKNVTKNMHIMFNVYKDQLSRQTGSRNLTGPKTLPTIWYTYMMLRFALAY